MGIVPLQSYNHSKDLKFLMHNGQPPVIKIIITAFKHIKHNTDRTLCHFVLSNLLEYCKSRGALPGPLFCQQNLVPITVYQFNTELSRCLQFCGLDTSRYKGHSFRIGAASLAADNGLSDAQIRTLGRWKSDAFKIYIRSERLQVN